MSKLSAVLHPVTAMTECSGSPKERHYTGQGTGGLDVQEDGA